MRLSLGQSEHPAFGPQPGGKFRHFVWHYRTLAAAKQAALLGIRGFTLRTSTRKREPDVTKLKPYVQ
jgi:5'-nucleotidase